MSDPTIAVVDQDDPRLDEHLIKENLSYAASEVARRVPPHYRRAVVESCEIRAWVTAIIERAPANGPLAPIGTGPSVLLIGPVGTGKTYNAYGVIRALAVSGVHCPWEVATATDIYARLRPHPGINSEDEFKRLAKTPLLVIDDLGAGKASEWTEEVNYRLINQRYEWERPTIIASNVPPSDLRSILGDRVASRLAEMAIQVTIKGFDRRRQNGTARE